MKDEPALPSPHEALWDAISSLVYSCGGSAAGFDEHSTQEVSEGLRAYALAERAAERERCAKLCEAEAARARKLAAVHLDDGRPLYDAKQMDAGACALEHVAAAIRGQP